MAQYLSSNDGQQSLPIEDVSHSAEASRIATRLVGRAGFNETETGTVALIVTELATNLLKHAKRGEILLRLIERGAMLWNRIFISRSGAGHRQSYAMFSRWLFDGGKPGNGLGSDRAARRRVRHAYRPGQGNRCAGPAMAQKRQSGNLSRDRMRYRLYTRSSAKKCVATAGNMKPWRTKACAWSPTV